MKKPASLRQHLLNSVAGMSKTPDQVKVFIEKGSLRSTNGHGQSYSYSYQVSVLLTDYAGSPDAVVVPLLEWVRVNQNELMANQNKHAESIQFEVEFLDNSRADLMFTLPLTERVIVKQDGGKLEYSYPDEPQLTPHMPATEIKFMANDEVVASFETAPPLGTDIETPHPPRRPLIGC